MALVPVDTESPKGKSKTKRAKFSQIGAVPLPDEAVQPKNPNLLAADTPTVHYVTSELLDEVAHTWKQS
eukprot:7463284-Karenia_brevis.AAC.1